MLQAGYILVVALLLFWLVDSTSSESLCNVGDRGELNGRKQDPLEILDLFGLCSQLGSLPSRKGSLSYLVLV